MFRHGRIRDSNCGRPLPNTNIGLRGKHDFRSGRETWPKPGELGRKQRKQRAARNEFGSGTVAGRGKKEEEITKRQFGERATQDGTTVNGWDQKNRR